MRRLTARTKTIPLAPLGQLCMVPMARADDPPVLLCSTCGSAFVVRQGEKPRCTCGAVPCANCAEMLAARTVPS